jgi:hypothetical protein
MSLVNDHTLYLIDVNISSKNVIGNDLGRQKKNSLRVPKSFALFWRHLASHLGHVFFGNANNVVASVRLLVDQGLCWCHENNFAQWVPAVKIEHYYSCDKGFAQAGWEYNHCVLVEALLNDVELIGSDWHIAKNQK